MLPLDLGYDYSYPFSVDSVTYFVYNFANKFEFGAFNMRIVFDLNENMTARLDAIKESLGMTRAGLLTYWTAQNIVAYEKSLRILDEMTDSAKQEIVSQISSVLQTGNDANKNDSN